ncbi:hypothetical protein [Pseudoalteromonas umbrosa]|uniref:hypothetical protein n=1 Tax=Pseudoalteromonas umbrosa TaxID=3048489 RepID=UPI0024C4256F|nr:hypothetical protein [Pseudoalteromonas sp. B95]MDK1290159.1 hypothetical protein [Pseudoalteromonas sp. B95]
MSNTHWDSATALIERIARLDARPELKVILKRHSHRVEYAFYVRTATGETEPVIKVGEKWYYANIVGDEEVPAERVRKQGMVKQLSFDSEVIDESLWPDLTTRWHDLLSDAHELATTRADLLIVDGLKVSGSLLTPFWQGREEHEAGAIPYTVYEAQNTYEKYLDEVNKPTTLHQEYVVLVPYLDALIDELEARLRDQAQATDALTHAEEI